MIEVKVLRETPNYLVCISDDGPVHWRSQVSTRRNQNRSPQGKPEPKPFKVSKKRIHDPDLERKGSEVIGGYISLDEEYATQLGIWDRK
jgi:hypothetical protein